jgi:hypothetical protein
MLFKEFKFSLVNRYDLYWFIRQEDCTILVRIKLLTLLVRELVYRFNYYEVD